MARRDYKFSQDSGTSLEITPLGAAMVEAMPDERRKRQIQRRFKHSNECPTSAIFPTKESVEQWYRSRKQSIVGV